MRILLCCVLLLAAACTPRADREAAPRIERDVRVLADDAMEGREAGTRGYDRAARHVVARMRAIGLRPGAGAGYLQPVPLLRGTRVREGSRLAIERAGRTTELRFADDWLPTPNFNAAARTVTAPMAFVGQAVHAPELGHDDFAGIDLAGKVAVLLPGAPARFDNDRRAFHASTRQKLDELTRRGAVGALIVQTADDEARGPWARGAAQWAMPSMRLVESDGRVLDGWPRLQVVASVSRAASDTVFAGSRATPATLLRDMRAGTLRAFDLPGTVTLAARTHLEPLSSHNVVGRIDGRGALAGEFVVLTAHLDHVGIGVPVNGDAIHNGALDNALGVAVMLEAARVLAADASTGPRRGVLVVATTAEEKGLLGAQWFVHAPPVPRASIVANVNMDMPVLLEPTRDVVPIGIEHSTLAPIVREAAAEVGVAVSPDPMPEETVFVRSDQYAFIRAGIPAVYLDGGVRTPWLRRDASAQLRDFLRTHYHQPSDEIDLPIQYADAARLARLNAAIAARIARESRRPRWNAGDFFGERFARP